MTVTRDLIDTLGAGQVLVGDAVHERSAGIWRSDTVRANVLVRPRSTEEVSRALAICNAHGRNVVAHGGLTGLVESALTEPDDVVISLERLNRIEDVNPVERTATVQAGVILQVLQEAADAEGLMFPLDLGGRGSATIGGNIATNAGGNRVIRYGMTRDMVLGLEAVLADGTIVSSMNRMIKNNAGYDLKQLFIGTEGSLGIVTRAVLRLREKPATQATALVAVDGFARLAPFLKAVDAGFAGNLSAFELMWHNFYSIVTTPPAQSAPPLSQQYPYYVLVEALGADERVVHDVLGAALESGLIADAVIAQSEAQRLELWRLRDDVEQCFNRGPCFIFDVSLPIAAMERYVAAVNDRLAAEFDDFENFTFGHMGDGNLHFLITVGGDSAAERRGVERAVYEPLAEFEGSVSAEHGVGLEKKPYLAISRTDAEIALMRTLKQALDPKGILNTGKVFDVREPAAAQVAGEGRS